MVRHPIRSAKMRTPIIILASLLCATATPSSASEAFVSQIGAARPLAAMVQSTMRDAASAARVASPIRLSAVTAAASTTPAQKTNDSLVAQSGTYILATLTQVGGNNTSTIMQNGTGNQAIVSQRRCASEAQTHRRPRLGR